MIDFNGYTFFPNHVSAISPVRQIAGGSGFSVFLSGMNDGIEFRFASPAEADAQRNTLKGLLQLTLG